jgi:hypothetical protein
MESHDFGRFPRDIREEILNLFKTSAEENRAKKRVGSSGWKNAGDIGNRKALAAAAPLGVCHFGELFQPMLNGAAGEAWAIVVSCGGSDERSLCTDQDDLQDT